MQYHYSARQYKTITRQDDTRPLLSRTLLCYAVAILRNAIRSFARARLSRTLPPQFIARLYYCNTGLYTSIPCLRRTIPNLASPKHYRSYRRFTPNHITKAFPYFTIHCPYISVLNVTVPLRCLTKRCFTIAQRHSPLHYHCCCFASQVITQHNISTPILG